MGTRRGLTNKCETVMLRHYPHVILFPTFLFRKAITYGIREGNSVHPLFAIPRPLGGSTISLSLGPPPLVYICIELHHRLETSGGALFAFVTNISLGSQRKAWRRRRLASVGVFPQFKRTFTDSYSAIGRTDICLNGLFITTDSLH